MKLPALLATDLHLTANPRDDYRWNLFPWLATQCRRYKVKTLLILGDLTDAKDYHSAELVNKISSNLDRLSDEVEEIVILMGNHDYLKEGVPFFSFLQMHPKITYVTEVAASQKFSKALDQVQALYLPHTKNFARDWAPYRQKFKLYDLIFMHQTVNGAVSENGTAMTDKLSSDFGLKGTQRVYSGDIHVPQVIGDVIYVGSPYPIHFGDTFKARCVLLEVDGLTRDLHFLPCLQRLVLDLTIDTLQSWPSVYEGDQLKIRIHLGAADRPQWDRIRREVMERAASLKAEVVSLELKALRERKRIMLAGTGVYSPGINLGKSVTQFVRDNDLGGDLLDIGLDLLEDTK